MVERAAHEPAIQDVLMSAEGASHPRQERDCHDHRPGQLPKYDGYTIHIIRNNSYTTNDLIDIIDIIDIIIVS